MVAGDIRGNLCIYSIIAPLTIIGLPTDRQRKQANGRLLKELHYWLHTKNISLSSSLADRETWVVINYTITQVDFVIKTFAGTPLESPDHCINAKRTTSVSFRAICLLVNGIISLRHWRLVKGVPAHGVNFRVRNFNQTTWTSFFMNLYTLLLLCTFKRARRMWC